MNTQAAEAKLVQPPSRPTTPASAAWNAVRHPLISARLRFRRWWESKIPLSDTVTLSQRTVYIVPSRAGSMCRRADRLIPIRPGV